MKLILMTKITTRAGNGAKWIRCNYSSNVDSSELSPCGCGHQNWLQRVLGTCWGAALQHKMLVGQTLSAGRRSSSWILVDKEGSGAPRKRAAQHLRNICTCVWITPLKPSSHSHQGMSWTQTLLSLGYGLGQSQCRALALGFPKVSSAGAGAHGGALQSQAQCRFLSLQCHLPKDSLVALGNLSPPLDPFNH